MDRLHFERAGFAATEADEELGRRAEADQIHIATMVEADGNGLGSCRRRPDRKGNGGAHLSESVRRQSLHTRRFVRTDRSAEPTSVSHTRPLHSRCSAGIAHHRSCEGFRVRAVKADRSGRGRRDSFRHADSEAHDESEGERLVLRQQPCSHELRGQSSQHAGELVRDERGRGCGFHQLADREQGQPHSGLSALHAQTVPASTIDERSDHACGSGISSTVLGTHFPFQPA